MMERIFNDENEPFWRSAKQIELGVIPPELVRAASSTQRFAQTGRRIDPTAVDARPRRSRAAIPTRTQELCYFLWEQTRRRRPATARTSTPPSTPCSAPSTRTSAASGTGGEGPAARPPGARPRPGATHHRGVTGAGTTCRATRRVSKALEHDGRRRARPPRRSRLPDRRAVLRGVDTPVRVMMRTPPYRIETERLVIRCYEPTDAPLLKDVRRLEHRPPLCPGCRGRASSRRRSTRRSSCSAVSAG